MALKSIFDTLKDEGIVTSRIDRFLMTKHGEDNDRAIDVNAPSQLGKCLRSRYYARTGAPADSNAVSPRLQRIFDNGTHTHERLQGYLKEEGILLLDEIPVVNDDYNIQGHTDGVLKISDDELAILEIKSINDNGFKTLKDAKEEHKIQGLAYIYCIENRRLYLKDRYKNKEEFLVDMYNRYKEYSTYYEHLKSGSKHSREEKINFQCNLHDRIDNILMDCDTPITKAVFLYENKNSQDLKEFVIESDSAKSKSINEETLRECDYLNECVAVGVIPDRCSNSKNSNECRWCSFKTECWN